MSFLDVEDRAPLLSDVDDGISVDDSVSGDVARRRLMEDDVSDTSSTSTNESFPKSWLIPLVLIYACHQSLSKSARGLLSDHICDSFIAFDSTFNDCYRVRWLQTDITPRLASRITETLAGALGALWWSKVSDISGRTSVLLLVLFGALLSDIGFAATSFVSGREPAQTLMLIFIALENAMGGCMTFAAITQVIAVENAYLTSRLRLFGLLAGIYILSPIAAVPIDAIASTLVGLIGYYDQGAKSLTSFCACMVLAIVAILFVSSKTQDSLSMRDTFRGLFSTTRILRRSISRRTLRLSMPGSNRVWISLGLAAFMFGSTVDILHVSFSDLSFSDLGALVYALYSAIYTALAAFTWIALVPICVWSFKRRNPAMSHDAATVARFVKTLAICSAAGGVFACFLLACVLSVPREYVDMVTSEMMFYIISMFVPAFTLGAVPAIFYLTSISVDEVHNLGFGMGVITVLYSAGKQVGFIIFNVTLQEAQSPTALISGGAIVWLSTLGAIICIQTPPESLIDSLSVDWQERIQSRESVVSHGAVTEDV